VSALADEGLTNQTISGKPVSITVSLAFNGNIFTGTIPLKYTAKANRSGTAR
jgi:hypothetical protein